MAIERTQEDIARFNEHMRSIDERLTVAVRHKLGTNAVYLHGYRKDGTGASIPVFDVPASFRDAALKLGMTIIIGESQVWDTKYTKGSR